MRRLCLIVIAAFLLPWTSYAQTPHTKSSLQTEIGTSLGDNNSNQITPAIVRGVLNDMVASWQQYSSVNAQSGTSYTIQTSDYGKLVTFTNASSVAVTLPQAVGSFSTFNFYASNTGIGTVTITPQTSTINGISSLVLEPGQQIQIISDGMNYQIFGSVLSFTPGTTSIRGATAPCAIVNTTGTTSGCITLTNNYLLNSSVTLGATPVSLGGTVGTIGTPVSSLYLSSVNITSAAQITGLPSPTNASDAATKQYVDSTATGLVVHPSVVVATATALPANTYNNGSSGVGATLTANANGALTVDGIAVSSGNRILVKNEAAGANNGIYTVTQVGSVSLPYILTRATDANTPGTANPGTIGFGSYVLVISGTLGAGTGWSVNSVVTTIGTSAISWVQFSSGNVISSVSNSDNTLIVSPITGAVVASLNTAHANTWPAIQTFTGAPNIEIQTVSTGQTGYLEFYDQTTTKWQLGKDSSNNFYILDRVASRVDLQIASNGNLALMPTAGLVAVGPTTAATGYAMTVMAPSTFGRTLSLKGNISGSDTAVVLFSGLQDGATWQIGGDVLGGATKSFGIFNITTSKIAANWDVNNNLFQYGNLYVGGGSPWVDVKSGANGCAAAAGNGSTNDRLAIQCQINWIIANDPYGQVRFPCGAYLVNGGGIDATNGHAAGSPLLQGESLGCVILEVTDDETALTLGNYGAAQAKPGLDNIFVSCTAVTPTTPCVISNSGAVDIKNCTIQGGEWGLVNHGVDGTVLNCYIANIGGLQGTSGNCSAATTPTPATPLTSCYGNLYTDGSNWYIRDKFDQNALEDISVYVTTIGGSGVSENSFVTSDSTDNARNSLVIYDNGSQHAIVAWSGYGPLSTPIYIKSANETLITNTNMNGGVSNSAISVTNAICGAAITGTGSKSTAGNIGAC